MSHIRPIAICVFRQQDRILVTEYVDPPPESRLFYRPLGGTIELGEHSAQTIVREIQEELGETVTQLQLLGTLENIYTVHGDIGHEIVQVYDGQFQNSTLYDQVELRACESNGEWLRVLWKPVIDFASGHPPLYPNGLYELLQAVCQNQTQLGETNQVQSASTKLTRSPNQNAINQGDIYWLQLEDLNGPGSGIPHPHIVIQDNVLNHSRLHTVVVCALTSNVKRASIPGNVLLEAGEANLSRQSVVEVSKVSTVDKTQLGEYIGSLTEPRINQILAGMRFLQLSYFQ